MLKAGLVLTDRPDVRITGLSFSKDSTERLDREWDSLDQSLRVAVGLLGLVRSVGSKISPQEASSSP